MTFNRVPIEDRSNASSEVSAPRFWYILKFWLLFGLVFGVAGAALAYMRNPDDGFLVLGVIPIALGFSVLGALYRYVEQRNAHRKSKA